MVLHRSCVASPQNNVPSERKRSLRNSIIQIETRNHSLLGPFILDAVIDRVVGHQRIARKVHLGYETSKQSRAKEGEMNMRGPPRIRMISPGVRARLDRDKAIVSGIVGQKAAAATEVRVNGGIMLIVHVPVAAGGVRLPNLN